MNLLRVTNLKGIMRDTSPYFIEERMRMQEIHPTLSQAKSVVLKNRNKL
ncbi:hypothetical protein [Metabacillus halosaccharovorans]|nr:hypothetical protein [Metabacillus halosaccharovorans]MCM3443085.1 hypothetical protein [Metabacillus halosaccharovorans]